MMQKALFNLCTGFAALALLVGKLSVNTACAGEYCQPKVPAKMLRK